MAFPAVVGRTPTNGITASATPVVNIGSPANGTLVVVLFRSSVAGTVSWPGGWTELAQDNSSDAETVAYRLCDGTEGATITLGSNNARFAALAYQITGAENPATQPPELSTVATGSSTTPDPTTCTPTGGAKDYLWLWLGGWEGEQTSPPTGNPANYTNPTGANSGTSGTVPTNVGVAIAERNLNASSEDPPSWTISVTDEWTAWTMAVHPAGGTPHTATQTDPEGLTDAIAAASAAVRSQTDPQGLTDTVAAVSEAVRSQTDPLGLVDDVDDVLTPGGGGAITLVGVGAQVSEHDVAVSPGSLTPPLPTGTQVGDILINIIVSRVAGSVITITPPSGEGWAERAFVEANNGSGNNRRIWVYWKIHDGSESDPNFQCTSLDGAPINGGWSNQIAAYRGVNTSTPWDPAATVTDFTNTNSLTFVPDPVDTVTDGSMALSIVATNDDNALALDVGNEQGFTARMSGGDYDTATGNDHSVGLADKEIATAATVTQPTWNQTINGADAWASVSDALKPAGGHSKTQTDPLGLTDLLAILAAYLRTSTDPLGLVDDATRVADNVRTQTDPAGLTDDVTVSQDHVVAVTDTLGLVDSAAGTSTFERTQIDPAGLTDTAVPVTDSERTQTDPLGLVDSAVDELFGAGEVSITDPLGLADSGSAELANDADPLGLTDSVEVVNGRSLTDPLGLVDSVETVSDTARSFTDPLGLLDTVEAVVEAAQSFTDPLGLIDTITQILAHLRSLTDTLGLTDDVTYDLTAGGVAHTATVTDSLGLVDSVSTAAAYDRTPSDPLGLVDSVAITGTSERSLTDLLGLTDSILVDSTGAHARQADDVLGLTDDITVSHVIGAVDYTATITDVLGLLDSETFTATYDRTVTDLLGLDDDAVTQLTGPGFWELDPAGYTANPVSHTKAPVAYVPVGPDDTPPPW